MPYITVIDTLFQGRVVGWRDENGKPIVYETEEDALVDAHEKQFDDDEPDDVIEVVVTDEKIYDPVDGRVYWEKGQKDE